MKRKMNGERFFELMEHTDDDLLLRAEKYSADAAHLRMHRIIRVTAVAASLCIVIAACIAVPLAMRKGKLPIDDSVISGTTDTEITESQDIENEFAEDTAENTAETAETTGETVNSEVETYEEWPDLPATEGLVYILSPEQDEYYVSDYVGPSTDIVIPDTYNGLPVTKILGREYLDSTYDSLILDGYTEYSKFPEDAPEWVKNNKRAASAFDGNENITSVQIGHNIESIVSSAFANCTNLQVVRIGKGVESIGSFAFSGCGKLERVQLSDGLKTIVFNAFEECKELTKINFPDSIESIGGYAFNKCNKIQDVKLPSNLKTIGTSAFENCVEIRQLHLPDSIESIGNRAFWGCTSLSEITLPDKVVKIGYDVLYQTAYFNDQLNWCDDGLYIDTHFICAEDISDVIVREGTKTIAARAFYDHGGVKSILCPKSLVWIGEDAFTKCFNVESIELAEGVQSIGNKAFHGCVSLTEISLPDSIIELGSKAFNSCYELKSVKLPKNLTSLLYIFKDCTALENIIMPESLVSISRNVFEDTAFYNDSSNWENGMLYIGKYLISVSEEVNGHVVIKEGTEYVSSFEYNKKIRSIVLPSTLKNIEHGTFSGCYGLFEVYNLSSLDIENMDDTENGFIMNYAKRVYKSLDVPTKFKQQGDYFVYCDEENGEYTIVEYLGSDSELILPDNIDGHRYDIRPYMFEFNQSITKVTVSEGVEVIGYFAFQCCENLTEVIINGSTVIGPNAFSECTNLDKLVISDQVKKIEDSSFAYCVNLKTVILGSGIQTISEYAFFHADSLSAVYYTGTEEQWNEIIISEHWEGNACLFEATVYFYSENPPTTEGKFWHYVDGVPTVW